MAGYFTYNNFKSSDHDIYIVGDGTYVVPSRNIKRSNSPGRNGDILDDYENYPNVNVKYSCSYVGDDPITDVLDELAEALNTGTYLRLDDTYHPDIYRLAIPVNGINPKVFKPNAGASHKGANFDVSFNCKPQKFLVSGDTVITFNSAGTINNPTAFESKPVISIYGKGTVTINGQEIVVNSDCPENQVDINCEQMDAWYNSTNLNNYVQMPLADIVLSPGDNAIVVGAGISKVEIVGRWWKL